MNEKKIRSVRSCFGGDGDDTKTSKDDKYYLALYIFDWFTTPSNGRRKRGDALRRLTQTARTNGLTDVCAMADPRLRMYVHT